MGFLSTVFLALHLGQTPVSPEHTLAAWRDLSWNVPADLKQYTRYLILKDTDSEPRVISGHVQHLSRNSDIVVPVLVENKLLRIYTIDYGWDVKVWEKLVDADPYCHIDVEVKGKKTRAHAPTLSDSADGPNAVAYLVEHTKSNAPILPADWFFNQTAAQQDRVVGYYDFLGVKTLDDFDRLVGFDAKLAKKFGQTLREAISISTVTLQPRAIERESTLGGGRWISYDFKLALGKSNPLRILGEDIEKFVDATEIYGHLPNGFWATSVFNGKNERQDVAPNFIAGDNRSKSNDKQVHVNVGCTRCHSNGGLKDLDGWFRNHFKGDPALIGSFDYKKYQEYRREYQRAIEPSLKRDRDRFDLAVKEATRWSARRYAEKYAEYWEAYEDARVDLDWMAKTFCTTPEEIKKVFTARLKSGLTDTKFGAVDLVLAGILGGGAIGIRQWEEVYPLAVLIWRGR